jgi:hypothetical protein
MRISSTVMLKRYFIVLGLVVSSVFSLSDLSADGPANGFVKTEVFSETVIHFTPDAPDRYDTDSVHAQDNGRVMERRLNLMDHVERDKFLRHGGQVKAVLTIKPIPKTDTEVHDKWDRAGNIQLVLEDQSEIELIKFVTAYGGETRYEVDITHLAPVLFGQSTLRAFIDTWVTPAWNIEFYILSTHDEEAQPDLKRPVSAWVQGLLFEPGFDRDTEERGGRNLSVKVPDPLRRIMLYYYASGHCTDGHGADEFESKDNVITVDGVVVHRYRPWRDDCRDFRAINPYCRRWSDGSWSCDYDRSGWCPGDRVEPLILDLTDHLTPGAHELNVRIDDVRPTNDEGHKGYWRVSAYLVGYR